VYGGRANNWKVDELREVIDALEYLIGQSA
jgi:hypothetical protein